ncbi:hypothetical protein AA0323_1194 [Asaia siamensis NRIC 0323]|nr:hypothetical protein AA0323_1194 [Asaia siamensis NRIC 0323]
MLEKIIRQAAAQGDKPGPGFGHDLDRHHIETGNRLRHCLAGAQSAQAFTGAIKGLKQMKPALATSTFIQKGCHPGGCRLVSRKQHQPRIGLKMWHKMRKRAPTQGNDTDILRRPAQTGTGSGQAGTPGQDIHRLAPKTRDKLCSGPKEERIAGSQNNHLPALITFKYLHSLRIGQGPGLLLGVAFPLDQGKMTPSPHDEAGFGDCPLRLPGKRLKPVFTKPYEGEPGRGA